MGRLCLRHDGLRGQCLVVADAVPLAVGVRLIGIGQVGLFLIAHIEQVRQEPHPLPLDAVAQQSGGGDVQEFAHQVQQRSLDGSDHMDAGAQVKGLQAADIVLDVGVQPCADFVQGLLVIHDAGADHQILHGFQCRRDLLAAGHFAHALNAVGIGQDDNVAGEVRCVRTGQVQLHAVGTGYGENFHFFYDRGHKGFLL